MKGREEDGDEDKDEILHSLFVSILMINEYKVVLMVLHHKL